MPTLTLLQAEGLVVRTLARCRTSVDNARSVARALIAAEADGLKGHGLSRLPMYAAQAKVRKVDGTFTPVASHPRPGLIAISVRMSSGNNHNSCTGHCADLNAKGSGISSC